MAERLNPGSPEASAKGCKCPVIDNHHGKGIRDDGKMFVINGSCPLHGTKPERMCADCGGDEFETFTTDHDGCVGCQNLVPSE